MGPVPSHGARPRSVARPPARDWPRQPAVGGTRRAARRLRDTPPEGHVLPGVAKAVTAAALDPPDFRWADEVAESDVPSELVAAPRGRGRELGACGICGESSQSGARAALRGVGFLENLRNAAWPQAAPVAEAGGALPSPAAPGALVLEARALWAPTHSPWAPASRPPLPRPSGGPERGEGREPLPHGWELLYKALGGSAAVTVATVMRGSRSPGNLSC